MDEKTSYRVRSRLIQLGNMVNGLSDEEIIHYLKNITSNAPYHITIHCNDNNRKPKNKE